MLLTIELRPDSINFYKMGYCCIVRVLKMNVQMMSLIKPYCSHFCAFHKVISDAYREWAAKVDAWWE